MNHSQRLNMRLSEIRQRLNEINQLSGDAYTDEVKAEADSLNKEYFDKETQYRSASIAEDKPVVEVRDRASSDDSESREFREIRAKVSVGNYLRHAIEGSTLDGAEAEYNQAQPEGFGGMSAAGGIAMPLELLELRQDAVTDTGIDASGSENQRAILPRLFGSSVSTALGVDWITANSGTQSVPLVESGDDGSVVGEGVAHDAVASVIGDTEMTPKRMVARYQYSIELASRVPEIEAVLRRDMTQSLRALWANKMINGLGGANDFRGATNRLAAPGGVAATSTFENYLALPGNVLDGVHASMISQVSLLFGVAGYTAADKIVQPNSSESALEMLIRKCNSVQASSFIAAPAARGGQQNQQDVIVAANGVPNASIACVWGNSAMLVRDPYTDAKSGKVAITSTILADFYFGIRLDAYKRIGIKTS